MAEVGRGMRFVGIRGSGAADRGPGSNSGARKLAQRSIKDNTPKVRLPDLGNLLRRGKGMITGK